MGSEQTFEFVRSTVAATIIGECYWYKRVLTVSVKTKHFVDFHSFQHQLVCVKADHDLE